ncbi:MAG: peptidyl-prolyl cis-trans isomerase [Tannerella sp.]|jgi:hypothetical protein|nr:peptidyl-prolyl cis-trans isomerase [Tannerella sp.]
MRQLFFSIIVALLTFSCQNYESADEDTLVTIDRYALKRSDVEKVIPKGASQADSLLIAENYIKKWIKDILVYQIAQRNIGTQNDEINRLVEEYRRSLLKYRYQEYLIQSRLSSQFNDSDQLSYYEANRDKFILDDNLIKGLFLKVPIDAPGLDKIRKQYRSKEPDALEAIEKFSMQQAVIYEYFYDKWVDFEDIIEKIPVQISNQKQYLQANKTVEATDSVYCYLLNIDEYLLAGNEAPFEYASPQIREQMINKEKVSFLKNFEEDLYRDAIRKGQVIFRNVNANE